MFTHISNLHSLLSDWIRLRDKGTRLCKSMSALKLYEFTDGYYPQPMTPLSGTLMDVLDDLICNVEGKLVYSFPIFTHIEFLRFHYNIGNEIIFQIKYQ